MADVNNVAGKGKGFFTETGELKSSDQLSRETKTSAASSSNTNQTGEAAEADFTGRLSNALGSAQTRFLTDANKITNRINQSDDELKQANSIVKEQIESAKQLKEALKSGDDEAAQAARVKLDELKTKRDDLASKIEQDNRDSVGERRATLRLGKEEKARIEVSKVEFSKTEENNLESVEDVNQFIDGLKADKSEITAQRKDLAQTRREVKEVVSDTKNEIAELRQDSLKTFDQAKQTSDKIASAVVQAGSQAVLTNNINESVIKNLLQ